MCSLILLYCCFFFFLLITEKRSTLKRVGVNVIPIIEKVNIFKDDSFIQFMNPKGSIVANTWIVNGFPQTKNIIPVLCSYLLM
ncbi:hypothetical protein MKW92_004672, partial [Papaver armeniacum]